MSSTILIVKIITLVALAFTSVLAGLMPLIISSAISLFYRISTVRKRASMRANAVSPNDKQSLVSHYYYNQDGQDSDFGDYGDEFDKLQQTAKRNEARVQTVVMKVLDLCQGFAGGVLLAAGLLHLLPEASEMIEKNLAIIFDDHDHIGVRHDHDHDGMWFVHYPWGPSLLCCSLFILIFVEDVLVQLFVSGSTFSSAAADSKNGEQKMSSILDSPSHDGSQKQFLYQVAEEDQFHINSSASSLEKKKDAKSGAQSQLEESRKVVKMLISGSVLWLSLTLHSLFEGLALGTQTDESKMWSIFFAIVSHKLVESFALGSVLKDSFTGKKTAIMVLLVLIFSMATPLGIGLGIVVSTNEDPWFLVIQAAMLAFACGAFIHVALEILRGHSHFPEHEHGHGHGHGHHNKAGVSQLFDNAALLIKYALFILGWIAMATLSIWA